MRRHLLDTSSLSLLAPRRTPLPEGVIQAVRRHSGTLFLPTVALAEIHVGICKLRRQGADGRAQNLRDWLDRLTAGFADRILAFDLAAAEQAGTLADAATATDRHPGFADVAIAAIALANGLAVVSENRRHFEALGVETIGLVELGPAE